jgi:phage portal protein BeeE
MPLTAVETQLINQLKWSSETVCSVYHVPPYKVGVDVLPRGFTNLQALNVEYYQESLQSHIEEIEELLDDALGIGEATGLGTEFDTENLLRMDSTSQVNVIKEAVGAGVMSPNEGRAKFDLKPVTGGESPYLQQQNYSLEALAKRDAQGDPFAPAAPPAPQPSANQPVADAAAAAAEPAKAIEDDVGDIFAWELKDAARAIPWTAMTLPT